MADQTKEPVVQGERKPRVLFHVTHFLHGGIETSLVSLITALDREGFEIGLTVTYPSEALETHFRARLPAGVKLQVLAPERWLSHCRQLKKARKLGPLGKIYEEVLLPPVRKPLMNRRFRQVLAQGYDVVVDYDMSLSRITGPLPVPMMGYQHFSVAHLERGHRRKLRKLRHQCRTDYAAVVMLTDSMLNDARALIPDVADKLVRLYNTIDLDSIRARANAPLDASAQPAGPYIVSVGRLEESQKDFTTLLHAYAQLAKEGIDEDLVLVGDGASRPQLEALAASLGIADRVTFAGFQSNPHAWIRSRGSWRSVRRWKVCPMCCSKGWQSGRWWSAPIVRRGRARSSTMAAPGCWCRWAMPRSLRRRSGVACRTLRCASHCWPTQRPISSRWASGRRPRRSACLRIA
jgi:glycosyltransferase involved in cell wall biosynthesis